MRRSIGIWWTEVWAQFAPELRWRVCAALLFLCVLAVGEACVRLYAQSAQAEAHTDAAVVLGQAQARVESELGSLLYLSSGLSAYFTLNADRLDAGEVTELFALLYADSEHVRNFGLAIGYVLEHVYPEAGNSSAVGLDYRKLPRQYEAVQQAINSGRPTLSPLLDLAQGGQGVIYRAPIFRQGEYWGLLSTVIDIRGLLLDVFADPAFRDLSIAVRDDGPGGSVMWGDAALFAAPDRPLLVSDFGWEYVAQPQVEPKTIVTLWTLRGLSAVLALSLAFSLYMGLQHREDLIRLSQEDTLTGLANRRRLDERIRQGLHQLRVHGRNGFILIFVDLDGFKQINDGMGHRAGDAVLAEVAHRLITLCRDADLPARWGGDEFAIFLTANVQQPVESVLSRFGTVFDRPVNFNGTSIIVRGSIGYALAPADGLTEQELIAAADRRMYSQKSGRPRLHSVSRDTQA
ncbi:MAG: sensor domain-containing diguanylate cyclase [Pseudomonadota bacterium]|nr:sensor domain-containing diguanylate cyclase [Pseudomonadota bacterium]